MGENNTHMRHAQFIGQLLSKDPNTRVGCIIIDAVTSDVLSVGWNSFPDGVDDSLAARWERPLKYRFVTHAEVNCIAKAARNGVRLLGSSCYVTSHPCTDCSRALIQAGVRRVVTAMPDFDHPQWGADWKFAEKLLQESGITVEVAEPSCQAEQAGPECSRLS